MNESRAWEIGIGVLLLAVGAVLNSIMKLLQKGRDDAAASSRGLGERVGAVEKRLDMADGYRDGFKDGVEAERRVRNEYKGVPSEEQ
jgi:hypothetical protein